MAMDIHNAQDIFLDYVAGFQPSQNGKVANNGEIGNVGEEFKERTPIDVKREHSLEVLHNARRILEETCPPPALVRLGLLAALFHDVGRFPQYQRYGTFHDPSSVNHGLLGAKALAPAPLGGGLLDALPFSERSVVRAVVAMHNRRRLPPGISWELRFLTNLVRDADKLDIMRVMIRHFSSEKHNPVITLSVKAHPDNYTQSVFDDVYQGRQGDYRKLRWTNDFKLLLLGWSHDLSFNASRRLLEQRRLPQQLFAMLPDTPEMRRLQDKVFTMLAQDLARPDALLQKKE